MSSSSSSVLTRDIVINVVNEYGKAWTTQNPNLLKNIFTDDAIYVERAFDRKATFIGLNEITKYWKYQICGKQSSIKFKHIENELIIDRNSNIAVVKWLAEFHNFRYNRCGSSSGQDKSRKKVRFCQMAKLVFSDSNKIEYLEEYAQDMTGPGVCWPGISDDVDDDKLWKKIRFIEEVEQKEEEDDQVSSKSRSNSTKSGSNTTTTTSIVECNNCHTQFSSRTRLFKHINSSEYQPSTGRCLPTKKEDILICFSLSYYCCVGIIQKSTCQQQQLIEKHIRQAFHNIINNNTTTTTSRSDNNNTDQGTTNELSSPIIWAVPIHLTSSAIVNVGTFKLLSLSSEEVDEVKKICDCNDLTKRLNKEISKSTTTATTTTSRCHISINIHTTGIVNRSFSPQRREVEKYVVFIPWKLLRTTTNDNEFSKNDSVKANNNKSDDNDNKNRNNHKIQTITAASEGEAEQETNNQLPSSSTTATTSNNNNKKKLWRLPIEETIAYQYSGTIAINRLKHAARLMKDYGAAEDIIGEEQQQEDTTTKNNRRLRVRTSKMDEEQMYRYCKISISMKSLSTSCIESIIKLLIQYTRFDINDDNEFIMAMQKLLLMSSSSEEESPSSSANKESTTDGKNNTPTSTTTEEEEEENSMQQEENQQNQFNFADFVILEEPSIANYEHKMKLGLTRSNTIHTSDDVKSSIDDAEKFLWMNQVVDMKQELLLEQWIMSFSKKEGRNIEIDQK